MFPGKEEASFSNMWFGQNIGYFIVYLYAGFIRVRISIILQIIYLTIALIGYFTLEIYQKLKKTNI